MTKKGEDATLLDVVHRAGAMLEARADLRAVLQSATDAATASTGAEFGAFFYSSADAAGNLLALFTVSGRPLEEFARFGAPRETVLFGATMRHRQVVRSPDITADPRFGSHGGMPAGHLPVLSYLSVPVVSRSDAVHGMLVLGHRQPGMFGEADERVAAAVAFLTSIAIDNARLHAQAEALESERAAWTATLERRVAERTAALRQAHKMEAVGLLASGVAHDFNNSVAAALAGISLLKRRHGALFVSVPAAADLLAGAEAALRRGAEVARRLLTFARQGELRAVALDPAEVLSEFRVSAALAVPAPSGIRLVVEDPGALAPVLADPSGLHTTLINLATNARDAMPDGGTLTVSACVDGGFVRFSVSDTGTGMDEATLAKACDPFFTTKPPDSGTGLGLAMAHGFAAQSGGKLGMTSEPGRGTTVSLWLPLAPE